MSSNCCQPQEKCFLNHLFGKIMNNKSLIINYDWLSEDMHCFTHWLQWKRRANCAMVAPAFHLNKQSLAWDQVSGLQSITSWSNCIRKEDWMLTTQWNAELYQRNNVAHIQAFPFSGKNVWQLYWLFHWDDIFLCLHFSYILHVCFYVIIP